ncbi:protein kinase [Aerosakkonema sp. BLCC-F183]|uniref:protein kinase domain-containing protein n=1 Tax=Aerosakkonema sp. BLCC-F183 TaxID=3342834 RepID=UPI0035BB97B6
MTFLQGQPLQVGQIVGGHYRIIKLLGKGSFGETYLAEDSQAMDKKCAVKRLTFVSNDPSTFNKAKDLFKREASVLHKLTNPPTNNQIPQFFAHFDDNQEFYLVQELIEGHTLSDELQRVRTLPEEQVVELLEDVLKILEYIHSQGIIHRDIKPENLMRRNRDKKIVLIDFGAVKEVVARSIFQNSPQKGTQIHTAGYAPKEQRQGDAKPNSDIYALGMTAIEALTGLNPEKLPTDPRTGEVAWRDKAQVSNGLAKILEQMVRDDWHKRYRSTSEVLEAVEKFKNTLIVSPGQGQSVAKTQPIQGRASGVISQMPLLLLFAILAPIVMFVSFGIAFLVKPIDPTPRVSTPTSTKEDVDAQKGNTENKPCPPILAPGQRCKSEN